MRLGVFTFDGKLFMQHFARLFLGSLFLSALSASPAAADYVYNVNLSDPVEVGSGDVSISGTITVDQLGMLSASDFVSYSLTFSSPNYPSATLTTANSSIYYDQDGSYVSASATQLSITFPAASTDDYDAFQIAASNNDQALVLSQTYGLDASRVMINGTGIYPHQDESYVDLGGSGITSVIGTAAAVPEPSSLLLAASGIAAMTFCRFRRRKPMGE
jgi:hypothetical protein